MITNLTLGTNWKNNEWPEIITVSHTYKPKPIKRFIPEEKIRETKDILKSVQDDYRECLTTNRELKRKIKTLKEKLDKDENPFNINGVKYDNEGNLLSLVIGGSTFVKRG